MPAVNNAARLAAWRHLWDILLASPEDIPPNAKEEATALSSHPEAAASEKEARREPPSS
jgi:hypothetical protein